MESKGFIIKLNDDEKTMFVTNQDTSNGIRFVICDGNIQSTYDSIDRINEIVIPDDNFIQFVNALESEAEKIKAKQNKKKAFQIKTKAESEEKPKKQAQPKKKKK